MSECGHDYSEIRVKKAIDGRLIYLRQCLTCGRAVSRQLSHQTANREATGLEIPPFDDLLEQEYLKHRSVVWANELRERREQKNAEWFAGHNEYLRSEKWRAKRQAVLERDRWLCQACRAERASEVHHLTYQHHGDEPLFDLASICRRCHEKLTAMDRERQL